MVILTHIHVSTIIYERVSAAFNIAKLKDAPCKYELLTFLKPVLFTNQLKFTCNEIASVKFYTCLS